jgi:N-formylglutamate amidohydrolase
MLVTPISRLVIDMNRPPDDAPLYDFSGSGLSIGLVPGTTFSGEPVYRQGCEPGTQEKRQRVETYWNPYHQRLQAELSRIRSRFGHAVLLDAHSIRSEVPLLFRGRLPDLNLGSNDGASAAPDLLDAAGAVLRETEFSLVVDGRFKGGYITRHYGVPASGVHALQLEMTQSAYMKEDPPHWSAALARPMQSVVERLVETLIDWKPDPNGP